MLFFGGNALRRWIAALAFSLVCIVSLDAEDAPTEEAAPSRLGHEPQHYAPAHARAVIVDRAGHSARIELHLAFQPEAGNWVLREIRETPS